jgi:hypothetical protein
MQMRLNDVVVNETTQVTMHKAHEFRIAYCCHEGGDVEDELMIHLDVHGVVFFGNKEPNPRRM